MQDAFITIAEASKLSGLSQERLRELIGVGAIPKAYRSKKEKSKRYNYTIFRKGFEKWIEKAD